MSEQTAVTKRAAMAPEKEARLAEIKAQNAMAAQIRGQMWAKDASHETIRAVAEYCRQNGLDPVRHVELLGGRVYLTATLYEERAAPLIQRGILIPREPDFINADPRLDALANAGDEWAVNERTRRMRLRIEHNVPEKATAAVCASVIRWAIPSRRKRRSPAPAGAHGNRWPKRCRRSVQTSRCWNVPPKSRAISSCSRSPTVPR